MTYRTRSSGWHTSISTSPNRVRGGVLKAPRKLYSSCIGPAHACVLLTFIFSVGVLVALQSERAKLPWQSIQLYPTESLGNLPPQQQSSAAVPPLRAESGLSKEWRDREDQSEHRNRPPQALKIPHRTASRSPKVERGTDTALRIYTDDMRGQVGMCRFPSACVDTRGVLYVPDTLKRFHSSIGSKCALDPSQLSFYDPKRDVTMLDETITRMHPETHVAGRQALRYHIPHMVGDLLAVTFLMTPYLQRQSDAPWKVSDLPFHPPNTTVHCFEPAASLFGARPYACGSLPPATTRVLVEERAGTLGWAAGLFALFGQATSLAPLQILFTNEAFPPEPRMDTLQKKHDTFLREQSDGRQRLFKPRRACFDSVSIPGLDAGRRLSAYTVQQNVLLKHSGIVREIAKVPATSQCRVNVTIVNRPKVEQTSSSNDPFSTERRRMVNVDAVREELEKEAKRLRISLNLVIREDFDRVPFREQFDTMQRTHSLISVHGAELANTLFMRRATTVVEVYPFRYTPAVFANMMHLLGLMHQTFIADPDIASYKKCLLHYNKPNDPSREATERAIERFEKRAATFQEAKKTGNSQALGAHWDSGNFVRMARPCARGQKLVVDPVVIARRALADYSRLCYGEPDKITSDSELR